MQPTIHLDPVNKYQALRSKLKKKRKTRDIFIFDGGTKD
jgi:hypothetical protein